MKFGLHLNLADALCKATCTAFELHVFYLFAGTQTHDIRVVSAVSSTIWTTATLADED